MSRRLSRAVPLHGVMLICVLLVGSVRAAAQTTAGIAGVVRDSSGAVMPGVTVEAASPALIEKVRAVVSDEKGEYKIVDLRPGTYSVTFTLTGFNAVKREGIELSAGFVATVNGEMRVGAISETIIVTGATPIVDTQNSRTQQVLKSDVLNQLPSGAQNLMAFASMTLGAVTSNRSLNDVGGDKGEQATGIILHGSRGDDGRTTWDGMSTNVFFGGAGGKQRTYYFNTAAAQEVVVDTGGANAETETGGANTNIVPREGGNQFRGTGIGNFTNSNFSAKAIPDDLAARGATPQSTLKEIYDYSFGVGGPIMRDKVWFYGTTRWWGSQNFGANNYFNKSTDPYHYVPDTSRPAFADTFFVDSHIRITWQPAARHKLTQEEHVQHGCACSLSIGGGAPAAPEASTDFNYGPQVLSQTTWNFTATNRLLIQAGATFLRQNVSFVNGVSANANKFTGIGNPVFPGPNTYSITEQIGVPGGAPAGYSYNALGGSAQNYGLKDDSDNFNQRFAVSYVTGSHAFKTGVQTVQGHYDYNGMCCGVNMVTYTFRGGVPLSLTQYAGPFLSLTRLYGLGLYAQDQWTLSHLTLNLGVRFDHFSGRTLPFTVPAGPFVAARQVPELNDLPNFKDITPRFGASYDLFGDGKTAIKGFFGKYLMGQGGGLSQQGFAPSVAIVQSVTRPWNDTPGVPTPGTGVLGNGNFVPDCNLTNLNANGECGPVNNFAFGQPTTNLQLADDARKGWNNREYSYQTGIQLQHELRPNLAVAVGYFRTWWGNLSVTQNTLVTPSDFTPFCITAPTDARLGATSGQQICGLYEVSQNKFGSANYLVRNAEALGLGTPQEIYNGIDIAVNARWGRGAFLNGGISVGRETYDYCYANGHPELTPQNFTFAYTSPNRYPRSNQFCHVTSPWWEGIGSQAKVQIVYPIVYGIVASGTFKTLPGLNQTANLVLTSAQVAQTLGRPLSGNVATATIGIIPIGGNGDSNQGTVFDQRLNETDLRFSKIFRAGRTRFVGNFDIYNVFNNRSPQGILNTYSAPGGSFLRPTSLLGGRLFKFGGQIDF